MNKLPLNVWILMGAQSLLMSVNSMVVFVGALIGTTLAPVAKWATLPSASIIVGTAISVVPVTILMKKIGRKKSFISIALFSIVSAVLTSISIYHHHFYWFCLGTFSLGITSACVQQFRFAAMESVSSELIPNAASGVLIGGIAAAFIGPEIALLGKDLLSVEFAGSFVLLAGLFCLGLLLLMAFKNPAIVIEAQKEEPRPLKVITKQIIFWVALLGAAIGYAIMSFIMTATPVSMHIMDGHSLENTKWVIQSHIVAMFLPSLITGWIIRKIGISKMMVIGLAAYLICIIIGYSGHHLHNYWISLILLGIGWNFLFVGGTALLPQAYQPSERFKVQALNEFTVFGTQAIASLSAGWIVFTFSWEWMLLLTLPLIAVQLIIIARWGYLKSKATSKLPR